MTKANERRWRWHWQDLRGDWANPRGRTDDPTGLCTHGRAWLYGQSHTYQVSWHLGAKSLALTAAFSSEGESSICIHVAIPFIGSFFFIVDGARWTKRLPFMGNTWDNNSREIGFSWYDGYLSVRLWCRDGNSWSRGDRWWHFKQPILINPADIFLGRQKYSEETLEEGETTVPMPEADYPATYRLFRATWKRPRWPWPLIILRANIAVEGGIPVPGKGENSWDMDDDAIFSMTCAAATKEEATQIYKESVLRDRMKYFWKPEQVASK